MSTSKNPSLIIVNYNSSKKTNQLIFSIKKYLGENIDEIGTRFPDMSNVYDKNAAQIARADIPLNILLY